MRRATLAATLAALSLFAFAMPATATVHEITGMFCAGEEGGNPTPPGISGRSNPMADNFAKPLIAVGFIESIEPYLDGILVTFDFDHPASKLVAHPTEDTFSFGGGVYVSAFVLDPDHGFTNCAFLRAD